MKYPLCVVALPVLVISCAMTPTLAVAQTVKDAGFETPGQTLVSAKDTPAGKARIDGVVAEGWADQTSWGNVRIAYSLDAANAHSGKYAQKIEILDGFAHIVQPVTFDQAGLRTASVWIRSASLTWATLALRQAAAPYSDHAALLIKVTPEWRRVTLTGYIPAGNGFFEVRSDQKGTLWIDDAGIADKQPEGGFRLTPPAEVVPRSYFGMHINHLYETPFLPWPDVDFGTARTVDCGPIQNGPTWAGTEKSRRVFDWTNVDAFIAGAARHRSQVILNLYLTPKWASSTPTLRSAFGTGYSAPPKAMAYWTEWVEAVVAHCKGRVTAYEIWNEPDSRDFWSGTPAQLVTMEGMAARIIKRVDPGALLVAAPVSGGNRLAAYKWYDEYLTAGGGKAADVLAVHFYGPTPEDDTRAAVTLRGLIADHGLSKKPLWNTETGWGYMGVDSSEARTIAFVGRSYILDWALGVSRNCWYSWSEISAVGVRSAGGKWTPTPGALAYGQVERWMVGAQMLSCAVNDTGRWTCELLRPDGSHAWIVWNTDGARPFPVPADWKGSYFQTLSGTVTPFHGTDPLAVGTAPVLIGQGKLPEE